MTACIGVECSRAAVALGYCHAHWKQFRKSGTTKKLRHSSPHRTVMEQMLGRPLLKGESVHHKNGDRLDNRPENLELWSKAQPAGQRVTDKLRWAREIIALYAEHEALLSAA